jgi:hypothetical protein
MSANSLADLPLRGNVVASPSEDSSRGFQIGEPASIAIDYSRPFPVDLPRREI